jgi:hypothetical protein
MRTRIVELTNGFNWGKFLLCRFDDIEWRRRTAIPDDTTSRVPLLAACGWAPEHLGVFDLATGEGAFFLPGGNATADLAKHQIWVCPMYEPFLAWLYKHPEGWTDFDALPDLVTLTDDETRGRSALYGHRRAGPTVFERIVTEVLELQERHGRVTREGLEAILTTAIRAARKGTYGEEPKEEGR